MNIYLQPLWRGTLAQLVEQRTENPCVPGSIPGGTTKKSRNLGLRDFLFNIIYPLTIVNFYKKVKIKLSTITYYSVPL